MKGKGNAAYSVRRQLTSLIANSRYGRIQYTPKKLEEVSSKLGVTEQLLLDSVELAKQEGIYYKHPVAAYEVVVPEEITEIVRERALDFKTTTKGLYRSLIYEYLTHRWEPPLHEFWWYKGKRYFTTTKRIRLTFSDAAREALYTRAEKVGTTPSRVSRSLILEFLNGNCYPNLEIVTRAKFSQKLSDYWLG